MTKQSEFYEYLKNNKQGKEESDFTSDYDDNLDECYPEVRIGVCTFSPSRILSELDPIAYGMGLTEFVDEMDDLVECDGLYYTQKDYDEAYDEYENQEESEEYDETADEYRRIREENLK